MPLTCLDEGANQLFSSLNADKGGPLWVHALNKEYAFIPCLKLFAYGASRYKVLLIPKTSGVRIDCGEQILGDKTRKYTAAKYQQDLFACLRNSCRCPLGQIIWANLHKIDPPQLKLFTYLKIIILWSCKGTRLGLESCGDP